jgi:hypothetical protein
MNGRGLIPLSCALGAAALLAVSGASAHRAQNDPNCTWGASSVTATLVDGKLVESQPQTTGCIPNP